MVRVPGCPLAPSSKLDENNADWHVPWSAQDQLELFAIIRGTTSAAGAESLVVTNPRLLLLALMCRGADSGSSARPLLSSMPQSDWLTRVDWSKLAVVPGCRRQSRLIQRKAKRWLRWKHWKQFVTRRQTTRQWRRQLRVLIESFCPHLVKANQKWARHLIPKPICRTLATLTTDRRSAKALWQQAKQIRKHELLQLPQNLSDLNANPIPLASTSPVNSSPHVDHEFAKRLETEKLQALRRLAYGASHEINNPLANIAMRAQSLIKSEPNPERQRKLEAIHFQALRAHEMISDLMLFANPPQIGREPISLVEILQQVIGGLQPELDQRQITIQCPDASEQLGLFWQGDRSMMYELLRALTRNAIESIGKTGSIVWQMSVDSQELVLSIVDSGAGIPPQIRDHIFDPFFSGREAGRGLGFGLSKAWRIAELHQGKLCCLSSQSGNTVFRLRLPLNPDGGI